MADTARDIYVTGLHNAHGAEKQAVSTLTNAAARLEHYPELRAAFERHAQESEVQASRIEQILGAMGESPSTIKDVGMKIVGNLQSMIHTTMEDEVLKNAFTAYAYEHFEIASYTSLLAMAEAAGDAQGPALLRQTLQEEERTAKLLEGMIEQVTRRYIQLETSGQTAGV